MEVMEERVRCRVVLILIPVWEMFLQSVLESRNQSISMLFKIGNKIEIFFFLVQF